MSVDQNALSCAPSSVSATNAESGANSMLASWKGLNSSWNQETADAVGKAAADYALKWNAAIIPVIDEKIAKFQAEYDAKKVEYESAKAQRDNAKDMVKQAIADIDKCREIDTSVDRGGLKQDQYIITDRIGYNNALNRQKKAEAEVSRYETQMNNWKKQMDSAKTNLSKAEDEKSELTSKIEKFILSVYDLNLMNESAEFLRAVKFSNISLSDSTSKKLFGRLFFIENTYRKQFEQFEKIIKDSNEKYKSSSFILTPESLDYSAERLVKANKFKGKILISLRSNESSSATLSFTGNKEFIIPKKKLDGAQEKIQPAFKNFKLKIDRTNFIAELNEVTEKGEISAELEQLDSRSDEYATEFETILNTMTENGASSSVFRIFFGKIGNKFAHAKEKREAYKNMSPEERKAAKAAEKQAKLEAKNANPRRAFIEDSRKRSIIMLALGFGVIAIAMFLLKVTQ